MKRYVLLLVGMLATGLTAGAAAQGSDGTQTAASAADQAAISQLVNNYARYMTDGNEKGFQSLLLDQGITFSAVSTHTAIVDSNALKNYAKFRADVFESGIRYRQTVSNIKIDKVGPLAEVSLTFTVEPQDGKGKSYTGWKILQLVKSKGAWKIASELYTFDLG